LYCTLCCVFVYFYFNPAFGLQLSLIKLSAIQLFILTYAKEFSKRVNAKVFRKFQFVIFANIPEYFKQYFIL